MTAPAASIHPSNLLTYASLAAGVGTIAAAVHGSAAGAGACLAAAALADTFDGRFARRFARSAEVAAAGAQLDSLVDAVVFGIVPVAAIGVLLSSRGSAPILWWGVAVLYAICALTRLAHFNVAHDDEGFTGLPTPVAALVWSTLLLWGPGAGRSSVVALGLGAAMIAPLAIGRPRATGLTVFASWPIVLLVVHLARL
jgi:CDP-diacylglycerol--serine O-phosphatidyltransferase